MPKNSMKPRNLTLTLVVKPVEQGKDTFDAVRNALDTGVFDDMIKEHGCELVSHTLNLHAAGYKGQVTPVPEHSSEPAAEDPRPKTPCWEYKIVDAVGDQRNPDSLLRMLNVLGEEGWEVISVDQIPSDIRFYFKRPMS